jgi:hypothetical protein
MYGKKYGAFEKVFTTGIQHSLRPSEKKHRTVSRD